MRDYHHISRSQHGLMIQILAGLIAYLLLSLYCNKEFNEKVTLKRLRALQIQIANELSDGKTIDSCGDSTPEPVPDE